jgi:hypothetical protein
MEARVQRRVSRRGGIQVVGQRVQVGFRHAGATVTVEVDDTVLRVLDQHGEVITVVARTTRNAGLGEAFRRYTSAGAAGDGGQRAAGRYLSFLDHNARISWRTCVADQLSGHTIGRSMPWSNRRSMVAEPADELIGSGLRFGDAVLGELSPLAVSAAGCEVVDLLEPLLL